MVDEDHSLTYETLLHVLPLRDDVARTLGQHHGVEERYNVVFSPEYLVEIILQIGLQVLDAAECLHHEKGVEGVDIHQGTAGVSHPLAVVAVVLTILQDLSHVPGHPCQHRHLTPALRQDLHHCLHQQPRHGLAAQIGQISNFLLQAYLEYEGLDWGEDGTGTPSVLQQSYRLLQLKCFVIVTLTEIFCFAPVKSPSKTD